MKLICAVAAFLALSLAAASLPADAETGPWTKRSIAAQTGNDSPHPESSAIANGDDVEAGDYPFMASLQLQVDTQQVFTFASPNGWQPPDTPFGPDPITPDDDARRRHLCGAALITDTLVVTAAHCFSTTKYNAAGQPVSARIFDPSAMNVLIGTVDLVGQAGDPLGELIPVAEAILHPGWNHNYLEEFAGDIDPVLPPNADLTRFVNDLAVVRLASPVSAALTPVQFGNAADFTPVGTIATILGWGKDETGTAPVTLQQALAEVQPSSSCQTIVPEIWNGQVCVGNGLDAEGNTTQAACSGDSGGPLLGTNGAGDWVTTGVVSIRGGTGCGHFAGYWPIDVSFIDCVANSVMAEFVGVPTFTSTSSPISLSTTIPGGTFSGPGVLFSAFNPQSAGPGMHTISYTWTDACGATHTITHDIFVLTISFNFVTYNLGTISP